MIHYPADPGTLLASDAFRRWLGWSAAAHLALGLFLAFGPGIYRSPAAPAPIFVEIVAPASRPAKRARQVVNEPVVIPKKLVERARAGSSGRSASCSTDASAGRYNPPRRRASWRSVASAWRSPSRRRVSPELRWLRDVRRVS